MPLGSMGRLELSLVRRYVGLDVSSVPCNVGGPTAKIALPRCQDKLLDLYIERAAEFGDRTPYYGVLWPSAIGLARHVGSVVEDGDSVLEVRARPHTLSPAVLSQLCPSFGAHLQLGCGLGLGGIAAALVGSPRHVTLTDHDPAALRLARLSARLSGVSRRVRFAAWDWAHLADWPAQRYDVAIAADIIYEEVACQPVAAVLSRSLRPGGRFLLADGERRIHRGRLREALLADGAFRERGTERVVSVDDGDGRVVLALYERTDACSAHDLGLSD